MTNDVCVETISLILGFCSPKQRARAWALIAPLQGVVNTLEEPCRSMVSIRGLRLPKEVRLLAILIEYGNVRHALCDFAADRRDALRGLLECDLEGEEPDVERAYQYLVDANLTVREAAYDPPRLARSRYERLQTVPLGHVARLCGMQSQYAARHLRDRGDSLLGYLGEGLNPFWPHGYGDYHSVRLSMEDAYTFYVRIQEKRVALLADPGAKVVMSQDEFRRGAIAYRWPGAIAYR